MHAGPLEIGESELVFHGHVTAKGEDAVFITFESRLAAFYDFEKIYAHPEDLYPLLVERRIKNFGFSTDIVEDYNPEDKNLEIMRKGPFSNENKFIQKDDPIQNPLLLVYYCRRLCFAGAEPGHRFKVVLPLSEFDLILTGIEKVETPAGAFDAYLFESDPEQVRFWIAKDEHYTPLKVENLTSFGPTSLTLKKTD